MIPCPYTKAGCAYNSHKQADMQTHEEEHYERHKKMVATQISKFFAPKSPVNLAIAGVNDVVQKTRTLAHQYGRQYIWKIEDFKANFAKAAKPGHEAIRSHLVTTARCGYRLFFYLYLRGVDQDRGCSASVQARVVQGEYDKLLKWPYANAITLTLLDQCPLVDQREHLPATIHPQLAENPKAVERPRQGVENATFGLGNFVSIETFLKKNHYVVDDCINLLIEIHD